MAAHPFYCNNKQIINSQIKLLTHYTNSTKYRFRKNIYCPLIIHFNCHDLTCTK